MDNTDHPLKKHKKVHLLPSILKQMVFFQLLVRYHHDEAWQPAKRRVPRLESRAWPSTSAWKSKEGKGISYHARYQGVNMDLTNPIAHRPHKIYFHIFSQTSIAKSSQKPLKSSQISDFFMLQRGAKQRSTKNLKDYKSWWGRFVHNFQNANVHFLTFWSECS